MRLPTREELALFILETQPELDEAAAVELLGFPPVYDATVEQWLLHRTWQTSLLSWHLTIHEAKQELA